MEIMYLYEQKSGFADVTGHKRQKWGNPNNVAEEIHSRRPRLMWALVAEVLIEENIAKSRRIDKEVTMSTYLQSWSPTTNVTSTLPSDFKRILYTGKKYNLCLDTLRILEDIKRQLPMWYHLRAEDNPAGFNRMWVPKCLKSKHQVMTVGELIRMTNWLRGVDPLDIHQDLNTCQCGSCTNDCAQGCLDPNWCCRMAQEIIDRLKPKWRPSAHENKNIDGLSLMQRRKLRNRDARMQNGEVTFDPMIARDGELSSYFWIFTQPNAVCHNLALWPMQMANMIRNKMSIYMEGACTVNDTGNRSAGNGIWYTQEMRET